MSIVVTSCTVPPERSILDQFFAAARLRDNTALSNIATVTFEPLEKGIIVDFEITKVESDQENEKKATIVAPVRLPDGQVVEKTLVITMRRGVLNDDPDTARRWIVTGVEEPRDAP